MPKRTREAKWTDEELNRLPMRNAGTFNHPPQAEEPCAVCGEPLGTDGPACKYGTSKAAAADDRRTGWFHRDHSYADWVRQQQREAERARFTTLLHNGGLIALGTPESRQAWEDGIPEVVNAIMTHFTPEERAKILDGAV